MVVNSRVLLHAVEGQEEYITKYGVRNDLVFFDLGSLVRMYGRKSVGGLGIDLLVRVYGKEEVGSILSPERRKVNG